MKDLNFRVGDKGWDVRYGNGYVININNNLMYSITVEFVCSNRKLYYMPDGRSSLEDDFRSLYHGHDLKVVGEQIPTREVWVNLWWNSIIKEVVGTRTFYRTEGIAYENSVPEKQDNLTYLKTIQIKIPNN